MAIIISAAFGVLQLYILNLIIKGLLSGNYIKLLLFLLLKAVLYGTAALLLFFVFKKFIIYSAIGYIIGMPVAVIIYSVYRIKHGSKEASD